jgi:glycerophosphoryl diester phosphodiesterase
MRPKPIVIAHRGASGYLPEHTLEAKALAHGMGADFLEQDVVATRDRELVVLHDLHLDDVSDVADVFPARRRPDGRFYVIDFELAELRTLRLTERRRSGAAEAVFPGRFPVQDPPPFRVATLDDELRLIRGLNRSTGRSAGIYPEIKAPRWHAEHGIDLGKLLLEKLAAHGYTSSSDAVFVQCFDAGELRRLRNELHTQLKLVQLVEGDAADADVLSPQGLRAVARYANGLGPAYAQLVDVKGEDVRPSRLAADARAAGLLLHPYTFRADRLPDYAGGLEDLLAFFLRDVRVDGVFCDHPDVAVRVRNALAAAAPK